LFLAGDDGAHDVWTINADGTDEKNVSKSAEDEWWPSWSPDGTRVAFVQISPQGHGSLVVVNADGSDPELLAGPFMNSNMPIWSPDGMKVFGPAEDVSRPSIIVYDLIRGATPVTVRDGDDGDWQRLAN
jgi:TolB protein